MMMMMVMMMMMMMRGYYTVGVALTVCNLGLLQYCY